MTSNNNDMTPVLRVKLRSDAATKLFKKDQPINLSQVYQESFVIGRVSKHKKSEPDLSVDVGHISRLHAEILRENEQFFITDMHSQNGTYLNGRKLMPSTKYLLKDQDTIKLAEVIVFRFCLDDEDSTSPIATGVPLREGLAIDTATRDVYVQQKKLEPQPRGQVFELLHLLYSHSGSVVKRDTIANTIWFNEAHEGISDERIDGIVSRLRSRLKENDAEHQYIKTVHKVGYQFVPRS